MPIDQDLLSFLDHLFVSLLVLDEVFDNSMVLFCQNCRDTVRLSFHKFYRLRHHNWLDVLHLDIKPGLLFLYPFVNPLLHVLIG